MAAIFNGSILNLTVRSSLYISLFMGMTMARM